MQLIFPLPTYGQVAEKLGRSSPGLMTKMNVVHRFIESDLLELDGIRKVTVQNNKLFVNCGESATEEQCRELIRETVIRVFSDVMQISLA